jgi:ABC-2 type transport system ATP-binding protein
MLVDEGVTVLLTTQYLDEADQLAGRIAVVDHGRVIAEGTLTQLKRVTGGARVEVTLSSPNSAALDALRPLVESPIQVGKDGRHLRAPVHSAAGLVMRVVRALDDAGVDLEDVAVHQPSLDDVFLRLTDTAPAAPAGTAGEPPGDQDAGKPALQEVTRC